VNYCRCEEGEATNLLYPAAERRLRVQKIEMPESSDPNKKYDPKEAERAWKDFFKKFPDMSAWELTIQPKVIYMYVCMYIYILYTYIYTYIYV